MMRDEGFTLVELLFALVAGSLLLITLAWAIRELEQQYRRHVRVGAAEKVEAITPFLSAEVSRALPPATGAPFEGTDLALTLVVPPPKALGSVGPLRLLLFVVSQGRSKALAARFSPTEAEQHLAPVTLAPVIIADGFKDIRFSYLRRATDGAGTLPRLITFRFEDRDGTTFPLGVEPRLTMGTDCVFDPIAQTCRH